MPARLSQFASCSVGECALQEAVLKAEDLEKASHIEKPIQPSTQTIAVNSDKPFSAFSSRHKWMIVGLASMAAIFAPMSSNIYVPAIPVVSQDFNKSTQDIDLTLTIYL
ncbi:hypothetical protein N7493_008350 [Penicillium malachiteum]|uniref:Major facilitator superfamily (MFS) profile domain-containing protein n=1 Tax=Penicillium malachiteum TaxID=1324776 RepID=A0AAD6MTM5_9EURO|nr:hypothetical protein N7493_008350 [Penicillium malachiteum]